MDNTWSLENSWDAQRAALDREEAVIIIGQSVPQGAGAAAVVAPCGWESCTEEPVHVVAGAVAACALHGNSTGTIPPSWTEAWVVSIFKGKGSETDPANYRPISLLNTTYKVFAAMIQKRLAKQFDHTLRPNQFGFRAAKGTRHPLFILRRSMEWSILTDKPLHFLFLDWKQAFDSIDHTAMLEALARTGLSNCSLAAVGAIYESPKFATRGVDDHTAQGTCYSGIRQGCPLSPYLFILTLNVILTDMETTLRQMGQPTNSWSIKHPAFDLEYADDTLLLALTIPQLQTYLTTLEALAL